MVYVQSLYFKLLGCNSVAWIYGQLGVSFYHAYMCILLYMKFIGCNGVAWIYAQFRGPSDLGICALFYM